jgi:hypothetical protein
MNTSPDVKPAGRLDGLLRPEVLAAFDRETFEREGYWVWENILTDEGRARWAESLRKLQAMNDSIVRDTDWGAIDFESRGLNPPDPEKITPEFLETCCGGSEQMKFLQRGLRDFMKIHGLLDPEPSLVTNGFESHGMFPEYWPGAYDDFVLDATTAHPQMMDLFGKVLGPGFLLDHVIMLNRSPGSAGRRWHAHQYRQGQHEVEDILGTGKAFTKEYLHQQCVRTLCYPDGATSEEGGEFAIIPGAHLYRIPFKWSVTREDYDEDMEANWLAGKTHAFTGEPLRIKRLSIPPGSMVSFGHHMPHHVGHRNNDADVRSGLLMALRTPDPTADPAKVDSDWRRNGERLSTLGPASSRWNESCPVHWAERMEAAGKLTPTARLLLEADNPIE